MRVRELLEFLDQASLLRLINKNNLKSSRSLDQKRRTLAYSYKGNLKRLIEEDLRKRDLVDILKNDVYLKGDAYYVPNLSRMGFTEIKDLAVDVFCRKIKSKKISPVSIDRAIDFFSVKYPEDDIYTLELDVFHTALKSSNEVFIASAFYDQKFFKKLFIKSTSKKFKKIYLIFNGLSGQRLKDQISELKKLYNFLRKYSQDCKIHLKMEPGIFHSKLYIFKGQRTAAFIGSINSTNAGLFNNEEILIRLSGNKVPAKKYFDRIWNKSKSYDEIQNPVPKNLIGFFRTGVLYFKPEYQFDYSFNPFLELLNELSNEEKSKLVEPIPHAAAETGIGPFSILRALSIDENILKEKKRSSVSIKPYCVETYLGYWVPSFYSEEFEDKHSKSTDVSKKKYEIIYEEILKISKEDIKIKFGEYKNSVKKLFSEKGIDYQKHIDNINQSRSRSIYDPFNDIDRFNHFFDKFKSRLEDEAYIKKLCIRFHPGPLPEIWDDHAAYKDFRESFFDYLDFIQANNINRRVPQKILKKINHVDVENNEEIEKNLISFLKFNGWSDDYWSN